jgi:hypothetical protein
MTDTSGTQTAATQHGSDRDSVEFTVSAGSQARRLGSGAASASRNFASEQRGAFYRVCSQNPVTTQPVQSSQLDLREILSDGQTADVVAATSRQPTDAYSPKSGYRLVLTAIASAASALAGAGAIFLAAHACPALGGTCAAATCCACIAECCKDCAQEERCGDCAQERD